jgi:hypothetical protein
MTQDQRPRTGQQPSERVQKANPESTRGVKRTRSNSKLQSSGPPNSRPDMTSGEPSADAILPSIERDEQDEIQATYTDAPAADTKKASEAETVEPESSTPNAAKTAPEKPFKCGSCGKGYTNVAWLSNVSISPLDLRTCLITA